MDSMRKQLILLLISVSLFAEGTTKVATTSAQFLKIGVGARAMAMGGAYAAAADDILSLYWNPGGLVDIDQSQIYLAQTQWLAGIDHTFFALGVPLGSLGTIGTYVTTVKVPEEEVTTVLQPEGTGEFFSAGNFVLAASYAKRITDRFSVGFSMKYINEAIWSMSATSVAMDLGTMYASSWKKFRIGIVLNNFGTPMRLRGRANLLYVDPDPIIEGNIETIRAELEMGEWDIPMNLKTSVSMMLLETGSLGILLAADMVHPNDNVEYFNVGTEVGVLGMIFLRAGFHGYGMDEAEGGPSLGIGTNFRLGGGPRFIMDYSYTDYGRLSGVSQFSLNMRF